MMIGYVRESGYPGGYAPLPDQLCPYLGVGIGELLEVAKEEN